MAERLGDEQRGHKDIPDKNTHASTHTYSTALQKLHVEGRCGFLGIDRGKILHRAKDTVNVDSEKQDITRVFPVDIL